MIFSYFSLIHACLELVHVNALTFKASSWLCFIDEHTFKEVKVLKGGSIVLKIEDVMGYWYASKVTNTPKSNHIISTLDTQYNVTLGTFDGSMKISSSCIVFYIFYFSHPCVEEHSISREVKWIEFCLIMKSMEFFIFTNENDRSHSISPFLPYQQRRVSRHVPLGSYFKKIF